MENGLIKYLDGFLHLDDFNDYSNNGLQVQPEREIKRVVFGVDISLEIIDFAVEKNADLIIVHHGISWSDSLRYITGRNYIILKKLMENGIGLYAAHAPLDAHRLVGNNVRIARALGVKKLVPFGHEHGITWGYSGVFDGKDFLNRVKMVFGDVFFYVSRRIKKIGIVSGGGGFAIHEAHEKGLDTLFTGETSHSRFVEAKDLGMNIIFAGHYRTETFGVLALKNHLEKKFRIKAYFGDFDTGL